VHPHRSGPGRSSQRPKRSGCLLRTQQRARNPYPRRVLVPQLPEGSSVLTGPRKKREPNNQCSTRKHGHRGRHSLPDGAGAP